MVVESPACGQEVVPRSGVLPAMVETSTPTYPERQGETKELPRPGMAEGSRPFDGGKRVWHYMLTSWRFTGRTDAIRMRDRACETISAVVLLECGIISYGNV